MKFLFLRVLRAINVLLTGNDVPQGSVFSIDIPPGTLCHVHGIEDPEEWFILPEGSKFTYPIYFPEDLLESGASICIDMSVVFPGDEDEDEILSSREIDVEH